MASSQARARAASMTARRADEICRGEDRSPARVLGQNEGRRTVATARAAIPSSRPVKPRRSEVVAFTATRSMAKPVIAAIRSRIAFAMRPDLRPLADDRRIDMRHHAATPRHARHGVTQEDVRCGALPLRLARREMRADVAVPDRAQNGVGDGVQNDIGIRVTRQRLVVRQLASAEPDVVARHEGVNIVSLADTNIEQAGLQAALGTLEIVSGRDLGVLGLTFEHEHLVAGIFGNGSIVGQVVAPRLWRPADGHRGSDRRRKPAGSAPHEARCDPAYPTIAPLRPTSLMVSVTGNPGTAAPWSRACRTARSIRSGDVKGRAPSWMRTISGSRPLRRASASRPACTLSCRVAPPCAGAHTPGGIWSRLAVERENSASSSGWMTGVTHSTSGDANIARIVRAISGSPAIDAILLREVRLQHATRVPQPRRGHAATPAFNDHRLSLRSLSPESFLSSNADRNSRDHGSACGACRIAQNDYCIVTARRCSQNKRR